MRKRIAPGLYDDGGLLHVDVPEYLRAHNLEDTEANRDYAVRAMKAFIRDEMGLEIPTVVLVRCARCGHELPKETADKAVPIRGAAKTLHFHPECAREAGFRR